MDQMKKSIYFYIMFAIMQIPGFSQHWTHYTTTDGLIGNSIRFILEDQSGYLWFATTYSGVTRYDGSRFQNFNTTNGLVSNNIYFMQLDKVGNIWFATDRGVCKYDGRKFLAYDSTNGMASNLVTFIHEDQKGDLWFLTDNEISIFDGKTFQNFTETPGLANVTVTCLYEDQSHNFWIGTDCGVRKYNGKTIESLFGDRLSQSIQTIYEDKMGDLWFGTPQGIFRKNVNTSLIQGPIKEEFNISFILEDRSGNLWFATHSQGVIKYDRLKDSFILQKNTVESGILSMLEDSQANLWFGDYQGIFKYSDDNFLSIDSLNGIDLNFVHCILEDGDENLWFGTDAGLFKYTRKSLQQFTEKNNLAHNRVEVLFEDKKGILWFGTEKGISKYDRQGFQTFTEQTGLKDNKILSIFEDSQNNIWFGSVSGVSKNFELFNKSPYLQNTAVRAIQEDRQGNLWFATSEGICKFDSNSFEFFQLEDGLRIFLDNQDNLWVGTWNNGLYKFDKGKVPVHYTMTDGLASNYITWILETPDGHLWFGLKSDLLKSEGKVYVGTRFDGTKFTNFSTESKTAIDYLKVAIKDTAGNLWFGTDKGILKLDYDVDTDSISFELINEEHGLASDYVTAAFCDQAGNLWFGSDQGVSKYDGENFQHILLHKYLRFGSIRLIFEDSQGVIWFVTDNDGVIQYIPPGQEVYPRIHLVQIEADQIYTNPREISIPTTVKRLTFEYKGISFKTNPERMRYDYRLEGYDLDWNPSTYNQRVHYEANLKPGTYKFKVRAIDNDLHYSNPAAVVTIHVFKPFYRTFLFFLLVGLGGFGIMGGTFFLIIQLRKQRQISLQFQEKIRKQKEAERIQAAKMESLCSLVAGIAHEINNPIGVITSGNDISIRGISKIHEVFAAINFSDLKINQRLLKTLTILEKTNKANKDAAARISTIVVNLRNFVRLDEGEWQQTIIHPGFDNIIMLLEPELKNKITVRKEYGQLPDFYCSPRGLNQVFMTMLKNAIEAIEKEGEIVVKTYYKPQKRQIKIEIKDNGIGISPENIEKIYDPGFTTKGVKVGMGLGLSICYKIVVDEHKGRIDVASELGQGATFIITLPADRVPKNGK